MGTLETRIKAQARQLGFDLVGIAPAVEPPGAESLRAWLAHGYAGAMDYLHRHAAARAHPRGVLPGVQSVVMAAMNYHSKGESGKEQGEKETTEGRLSCYAWGEDYHDHLRQRLHELLDWVRQEVPGCKGRGVVDTAPLLERDFARLAGLGWFGKNTMLLNTKMGSYFFLGALLLDIALQPDQPFETSHCGTCTACLEACPTQAFVGPGQLDARRCISYLTIELRGPIPRELRAPMGNWVFGCDICQDVCPWNRKAPKSAEPAFLPRAGESVVDLMEMLQLSPAAFRERFRGTPITRAKRAGFLRNVAIALGNSGDIQAVSALGRALEDDEPLIRGAAAWALGVLNTASAREALTKRMNDETDAAVCAELSAALTSAS